MHATAMLCVMDLLYSRSMFIKDQKTNNLLRLNGNAGTQWQKCTLLRGLVSRYLFKQASAISSISVPLLIQLPEVFGV